MTTFCEIGNHWVDYHDIFGEDEDGDDICVTCVQKYFGAEQSLPGDLEELIMDEYLDDGEDYDDAQIYARNAVKRMKAETILLKDSCCCGATIESPCACMKMGVMNCSATCPCSDNPKHQGTWEIVGAENEGWPNCASCNNPIPKDEYGEPDDVGDGTGRGSCCACVYCYEETCSGDCDAKSIYHAEEFMAPIEIRQMPQLSPRDEDLAKQIAALYQEMAQLFDAGELTKEMEKEFDEDIEHLFNLMSPEGRNPYGAESFSAEKYCIFCEAEDAHTTHYGTFCIPCATIVGEIIETHFTPNRRNPAGVIPRYLDPILGHPFYHEAETFEAPYVGSGALMDIGKDTALSSFSPSELATSSAIHGDFDTASLDYSGHQNLEVRAESPSSTTPAWVMPVSSIAGFVLGFFGIRELKKVL
jgi:hypothetical protein